MKKLVLFLLCGGLLAGCSSQALYNVSVSDGDTVLISDDKMSVTKQGYFEFLLNQYGASSVLDLSLEKIVEKEITDEKEVEKILNANIEDLTKYANNDLDSYVKKLGYQSKEEFIETVLKLDAKVELLHNKYIQANLDDLMKEYEVCSFKMIEFEKESEALKFIKEVKDEADFDKKLDEAKDNGEDAGYVSNVSYLDEKLKSELKNFIKEKNDGVYSKAVKLSTDKFAVVYLYDTAHKNVDEITSTLASVRALNEKITGIYLKKYNFTVAEDRIKDSIKKLSSQYIE